MSYKVLEFNTPTRNNRIYKKDAVKLNQESIPVYFCTTGYPVDVNRLAGEALLEIRDDGVWMNSLKFTENKCGKILRDIGLRNIEFTPAGIGELDGNIVKDYTLTGVAANPIPFKKE